MARTEAPADRGGWLSIREAADRLELSTRKVRRMIDDGELRSRAYDVIRVWHEDVEGAKFDDSPPKPAGAS